VSKLECLSAKGAKWKSQGNALGESAQSLQALKARNADSLVETVIIARLQRSGPWPARTWADGPGYYISRRWRWKAGFRCTLALSYNTTPKLKP
jgi:hypothetical protein